MRGPELDNENVDAALDLLAYTNAGKHGDDAITASSQQLFDCEIFLLGWREITRQGRGDDNLAAKARAERMMSHVWHVLGSSAPREKGDPDA